MHKMYNNNDKTFFLCITSITSTPGLQPSQIFTSRLRSINQEEAGYKEGMNLITFYGINANEVT